MKSIIVWAAILLAFPAGLFAASKFQDHTSPSEAFFKKLEGTWDVELEVRLSPQMPPMKTTGKKTYRLMSGKWLIADFQANIMGMNYENHSVQGFDPMKKKFVGAIVHNLVRNFIQTEGSLNEGGTRLEETVLVPAADGSFKKGRSITELKDADTGTYVMYKPDDNGKEFVSLQATYRRQK